MKFTIFTGAAAFFSLATATPIDAQSAELVRRQHSATSASVTGFTVTRNATHINYAATITIIPNHSPLAFTHATAGTAVPNTSGFWTSTDPNVQFRFNKIPTPSPGQYRLVLTDAHTPGSSVNLAFLSPVGDWAGAGTTVYTGPSSFTLS